MKFILLVLFLFTSVAFADINIGVVEKVKSVSANYTALISDDNIFVDATSGNRVITLPSAVIKKGKVISVTRKDVTANTIQVNGSLDYIWIDRQQKFLSDGVYWWPQVPYTSGTTYTIDSYISGFSSVLGGRAFLKRDNNNIWWMNFSFRGTTSGVVNSVTATWTGTTFANTTQQSVSVMINGTVTARQGYVDPNANTMVGTATSAAGTNWVFTGITQLAGEPSWSNESKYLKQKI